MRVMQNGESVVLRGEAPEKLRYSPVVRGSVRVWSFDRGRNRRFYTEGADFAVDYERGLICRLPGSAIGDYEKSPFCGVSGFDHTLYETYGNYDYMVYAEYAAEAEETIVDAALARAISLGTPGLRKTREKIAAGRPFCYCVFGDSISTGGEAVPSSDAYFLRFEAYLKRLGGNVRVIRRAVGGETSSDGMARFEKEILPEKPDLITIAYGMNDQNLGETGHFVEPEEYIRNIEAMACALRDTGSEVALVTPCSPNPRWKHASGDTPLYAQALIDLGRRLSLPVADVQHLWRLELAQGKSPESLLLNDINHPTAYGHYLYFCALAALI